MDIRQIEDHCASLSITEEEVSGLEAPDPPPSSDAPIHHRLVGRFLTDRPINFDHMQQVLASVWRPVMGMQVEALTEELFLFRFPHPKDLQRVIDDGPWSFENHTLVCERVPPESRPEDVDLDTVTFWVQIHGLPAMYASPDFLTRIGDYLGSFVAIDPNNFGGSWKGFYHVRARMQVGIPLKRRMRLMRKDGSTKAYENGISPESFPFGSWMRAGPSRQAKPVGAKWLLPKDATSILPSSLPGPSPLELVTIQESTGV
ncbi:PREDICTED: uncharacterized protein LOC109166019 [Ipomoea nil]|uniref:uncharacterized protein LOC109166019 n=1 Tax=Ipomoea nil TaxID=35883 RepID=UPI000900B9E7|nr:PREDICTED: uncharacterized protein LOC109166019 [Ipomoea nil]